ncbi:MAG: ABC transporter ATP-binding protein [Candidatus Obscuribacterales bacterium]|jgi:ABC-type polysaccharide/polyol phosphate transport system ATPase subunit|nr:ABC transporter ATP-binding protein [Candidatus Obscuribacterales bacterium]
MQTEAKTNNVLGIPEPKPSVEVLNISKCHKIYAKPVDRLKELVLQNKVSFHQDFWALNDVSITFPKGWLVVLLGPNGSGKSTLLQIIAGTMQPTYGRVNKSGRVTAILELGAGFQHEYTGRENVMLYGLLLGISEKEMESYLPKIIEFAEIGEFLDRPVKTYSSGMVVRLAYACATAVNPDILIVDEALAVGDIRFQQKCFQKIYDIQSKGATVILVTHDLEAAKHGHKAILLNKGSILCEGPPAEVIPLYKKIMLDEPSE